MKAPAAGWPDETTHTLLTVRATTDRSGSVRRAAVEGLTPFDYTALTDWLRNPC